MLGQFRLIYEADWALRPSARRVMLTMTKAAKRQIRQEPPSREPVAVTASVVLLAVVVLICAGMLVAPLWSALVQSWQFRPIGLECSTLTKATAPEACYDELAARAARHPAKGANAPLTLRPAGPQSE